MSTTMYIVEVVRVEGSRGGSLKAAIATLKAWYPFVRLWSEGRASYYIVAGDEPLEVFKAVYEASGYKVARFEKLEDIPWFLAGLVEELAEDAKRKALARIALEYLKPPLLGEKTDEQIAVEIARRLGLDPNEAYRLLLEVKGRLTNAVLVEVRPYHLDLETLKRLATRVGLIPLATDTVNNTAIFYSGRFTHIKTRYDNLLQKLDIGKHSHTELGKKLLAIAEREYGLHARRVANTLRYSRAYQELLARTKAWELAKLMKDANPYASADYNVFTIQARPNSKRREANRKATSTTTTTPTIHSRKAKRTPRASLESSKRLNAV